MISVMAGERYAGFNHSLFTEVLAELQGDNLTRQTVNPLLNRFAQASGRRHPHPNTGSALMRSPSVLCVPHLSLPRTVTLWATGEGCH